MRTTRLVWLGIVLATSGFKCNTGFNPGMTAGGRCFFTTGGPGSVNYFEYTPDCPGRAEQPGEDPFGPDHWNFVLFNDGAAGLQAESMGLSDQIAYPYQPIIYAGNVNSHFQAVLYGLPGSFGVNMYILPGAVNKTGGHIDFDLGNQATLGLPNLHSHHELWMASHGSKTYATSFVLRFTANGVNYALSYALRPHSNPVMARLPPGVDWVSSDDDGKYVTLDATYFGTPPIDGALTNVDIDWAGLAQYVHDVNLWPELDVKAARGGCLLQFYETLYGAKGTALGQVSVSLQNWTMGYP